MLSNNTGNTERGAGRKLGGQMFHSISGMPDLKILWDVQVKVLVYSRKNWVEGQEQWLSGRCLGNISNWLLVEAMGLDVIVLGKFGAGEVNRSKEKTPRNATFLRCLMKSLQ